MVRLLYVLWLAQPLIWAYALWPIGMLKLVLVAMVYHRLWGKTYPLKTPSPQPALPSTAQHLPGIDLSATDLQGLLACFDQSNNPTPDELGQLVLAAEEQAIARRFGSVSCGQVMTPQLWTCYPDASLDSVAAQFQLHPIKSLPVVDASGQLLGVVARSTLLDWVWLQHQSLAQRRQQRTWRLWGKKPAQPAACAADLMQDAPLCVQDSTPVSALLEALAQQALPFVAVLCGDKLVGLITRTDIMRLLLYSSSPRQA